MKLPGVRLDPSIVRIAFIMNKSRMNLVRIFIKKSFIYLINIRYVGILIDYILGIFIVRKDVCRNDVDHPILKFGIVCQLYVIVGKPVQIGTQHIPVNCFFITVNGRSGQRKLGRFSVW